jgi:ATP-binding cassette subfamily B protein
MWRVQARIAMQQALLVPLLEVAVLALAGVELARGRITAGELLAAATYAVFATSLVTSLPALTRIVRARAAARRVWEVLHEPTLTYGSQHAVEGDGTIEFRDVTVRAGERAVLDHVSITIPGGALTAIVGRSGAGKSLLAALAGRLRDPDDGDVLLDGTPLRELSHDTLRSLIGYGFEHPALLGDTISGAIAFGVSARSDDEVVAGAQRAAADEFVRRLPDGYANPLALTPLSGGEAQRIGLARAFAHEGRVLILDDVAASLDTVTEFHITSVLTGALASRTRIVVAHRISTASRADTVIWLEDGAVRAVAPHAALWSDLRYRAIFDSAQPVAHTNGNGHRVLARRPALP